MRPTSYDTLTPLQRAFALFAIAIGGFGIGSSEFVSMGILPDIAHSLLPEQMAANPEHAIAQAGWAVSAYAFGVVVGAPTVSLLGVKIARPKLIMLLALGLLVGSVLSATMPVFGLLVPARFLAGLPHGAFFGVAALLAADVMGPGNQGKGIALALMGLTVANLLGVPLLTAFGQQLGWRTAYWIVAGVFALAILLLFLAIPPQEAPKGRSAKDELAAFKQPRMWMVIVIECVGFTSFFAMYGYIADVTVSVAGIDKLLIPVILALAGAGMTLGNWIAGHLTDWSYRASLFIVFPIFIVMFIVLIALRENPVGFGIGVFLVSAASSITSPLMQAWLMTNAGKSVTLAAASHHGAFNVANSLGVMFGGFILSAGLGFSAVLYLAGGLALFGMVVTFAGLWIDRDGVHDINALNDESEDQTFGVSILRTETGEMLAIAAGAGGESVALEADGAYLESHQRSE
ncbi:MFS transporter [Dermabacter vaginalis]|uniref:MFS transporter n=1 Tax=Dermabacter vaginalis TaxID=1630135 RepID=A0ABX6A7H2_9MICO|nr:MFS transporter [Dermabacter vaginalis]QEU12570.1 MFS transporter [Dermabacter vaginalis]